MADREFISRDAHDDAVRINGHVKWFDGGKGYGFIVPDDAAQTGLKDVLLHVTCLRSYGRDWASEGASIICDVVKRPKGWQVLGIVQLDDSQAVKPQERASRSAESVRPHEHPRRTAPPIANPPPCLKRQRSSTAMPVPHTLLRLRLLSSPATANCNQLR